MPSDYEDAENIGFEEEFAGAVRDCIRAYRFRNDNPPQSTEAKVLFDADKIDGSGAIALARTLVYKGKISEPLYTLRKDGQVSNGENDELPSFFRNINIRWKIYILISTPRAARK